MATYLAFLRAINLGPTRKFPKSAILAATEAAGGVDVATYINSGNVRLTSPSRSAAKLEVAIEAAYRKHAGFEVPTIVFTAAEFAALAKDAARIAAEHPHVARHYVYLLKAPAPSERVAALLARAAPGAGIEVRDRAVHLLLAPGGKQGVVDPYGVEKALGVIATSRNRTVVDTLAGMWC